MIPSPSKSEVRLPPPWIGYVLGLGILLSLTVFFVIRSREKREWEKQNTAVTEEHVERLRVSMLRSAEVLHSIVSLHAAEGQIQRGQFCRFVQQALARQPELQALSWNPVVPAGRRQEFEAAAQAVGFNGFQFREKDSRGHLTIAADRDEYVPVYFIEPLEANSAALGYDLESDASRRESLERARDTGAPVASAPLHLAQGPEDQVGFLVVLPAYSGSQVPPATVAERRATLAGFAVAVFRVDGLVNATFRELRDKGIEVSVFDGSTSGELIFSNAKELPSSHRVAWLEFANRHWAIAYSPARQSASAQSPLQAWLVLAGGLAFTFLTTAYLFSGWRRTRQVAAANAALQEEVATRQRAEAKADAASQAKSDFLASMSHEIRTPLNAILGYTQLMRRDADLPPEQSDAVAAISSSGQHLLGLINEILDLSKIEAGRMELNVSDFDVSALANGLAATFRPLCAQKRIGLRVQIDAGECSGVHGDEGKLRQVLINLLGNAVKFTHAGEVYLHLKAETDGRWLFEVIDTGLGIPEDEQQHIFKPFHQGSGAQHQGGTGLGLAIAQRQVQLLGGSLELQSERGIGSRFFFRIPLAPSLAAVEEDSPARRLRIARGRHVRALVVDDNRENRHVLGQMLSLAGCDVVYASGGEEALGEIQAREFDVVFLDLLMPGVSGAETARRIISERKAKSPRVIAHTASALSSCRGEALAAGCVDFFAKPFRCEQIYEMLTRHLGVVFEEIGSTVSGAEAAEQIWVELPESLCARLMTAAELHSTTALKACLQELRQQGATRLADEIRHLMRSYDMDEIQRLVARAAAQGRNSRELTP